MSLAFGCCFRCRRCHALSWWVGSNLTCHQKHIKCVFYELVYPNCRPPVKFIEGWGGEEGRWQNEAQEKAEAEETAVRTTTGNCRCVVIEKFFFAAP